MNTIPLPDAKKNFALVYRPVGTFPSSGSQSLIQHPRHSLPRPLDPMAARSRWLWPVGLAILVALCLAAGATLIPERSAVELFWAPILRGSASVLVVTDTLVAATDPEPDSTHSPQRGVRKVVDPKTFLNVSEQTAKLTSFLSARGKHLDYGLARNISLAGLRTRPFILEGAFNNRWTQRAVAPFRFYFQLDRNPTVRRIIDRQNTGQRDWAAPMSSGLTEDYALIVRAPEPETGQMMLVIAGLGEKGSAAALEFVTNPRYLERFDAQAPKGWERRNIELVIKSKLINEDWGEPRVVPMNLW